MVPEILSLLRSEGGEACLGTPHGDFLVSVSECVLSQGITVFLWCTERSKKMDYGIYHN